MELHAPRPKSVFAVFWGLIALLFIAIGFADANPHWKIAALAPALLSVGLALGRRREFRGRLTETALEIERPPRTIPYAEIEGLTVGGLGVDPEAAKFKPRALMVMHREGVLEIPAAVNVPVQKLYQALLAVLPLTGNGTLSTAFAEHFEKEKATFGAERVHAFRRRKHIGRRPSTRRGQLCCGLMMLCGIGWTLVYVSMMTGKNSKEYEPWLGFGLLLLILNFFFLLYFIARQSSLESQARKLKDAELIISPTGIAIKQGDVQGHMQWDELLDVRFRHCRRAAITLTRESALIGLTLVMAGAKLRVADIYDRPIALIHQLIRRYWKKP
jgi:hypothetical protein